MASSLHRRWMMIPSLLLLLLSTASAMSSNSNAMKILLSAHSTTRHLEQQDGGGNGAGGGENDLSYLQYYSLKLLSCRSDKTTVAEAEEGADGSSAGGAVIIYRLCPVDDCNSSSGCKEGYGDFAVDISTFVEAYLEDQMENMDWGDDDNNNAGLDQLSQCAQYNGLDYYVGPTCTSDGRGIRMAVFNDAYCYKESSSGTSFSDISGGWTLPFEDGGLVSENCIACQQQQSDDDANEDNDGLCVTLYDAAPYKCEKEMDVKHYYWDEVTEIYRYGRNNVGCTFINGVQARRGKPTPWGEVFGIVLLVAVSVVAGYGYTVWWRKRRETLKHLEDELSEGSMSVDSRNSQNSNTGPTGTLL